MIEVQGVSKTFGPVRAVNDVSFSVPKGAVVGVLGPNGAGKSTTVRMIAGTIPPSRGSVRVDGLDSVDHSRSVRGKLGYLPESNPLYPEMRVHEYLTYRAKLFGLARRERGAAVGRSIERCWLAGMELRRVGALSKGYRQRVGLAAALLHEPELLILDEPTSGLDPVQIVETRSLIRGLAGEHTALIVSHALDEVEKTCDRLLIFAGGRLRADGSAEQLVAKHGEGNVWDVSVTAGETRRSELMSLLQAVTGVASVDATGAVEGAGWLDAGVRFEEKVRPESCGEALGSALAGAGATVRRLERRRVSLERLYVDLVTKSGADDAGGDA